jgi:hypothetical protein
MLVTLSVVAANIPAALASGEPKNQSPFDRSVVGRGLAEGIGVSQRTTELVIFGERKSQAPFTLRIGQAGAIVVISGEPKNQMPFIRR